MLTWRKHSATVRPQISYARVLRNVTCHHAFSPGGTEGRYARAGHERRRRGDDQAREIPVASPIRAEPVVVARSGRLVPLRRTRACSRTNRRNLRTPEVPPPPRGGHTADMSRIRVAVIDGQRTFADALASRLSAEPDMQLVAVSESTAAARRLLKGRRVDIVLLDSELMQSLDHPTADTPQSAQVILLGPVPDAARTVKALRAGVAGWVAKEESTEQLLHVIRGVMRGETLVPAMFVGPVLRLLLHGYREGDAAVRDPLGRLTPREREVLGYLAEGIDRREIAARMRLSAATVRSHVQNLLGKLGVHSTLEAVAVARQAQLGPCGEGG
jgi:DNA-binding NarL/FixJ family response regulator